jgi:hypothetical protein
VSRHAQLRRELRKGHITELGSRLAEQPAELRDRDAFTLMHIQVFLDPLAERQRRRTATGQEPGQPVLKRPLRLRPAAEPAHLPSRRTAASNAIPVGPQRLPVCAGRLQLEHLTLLDQRGTSSIDNEIEESHPRRDDDHPSQREGLIRQRTARTRYGARSGLAIRKESVESGERERLTRTRLRTRPVTARAFGRLIGWSTCARQRTST